MKRVIASFILVAAMAGTAAAEVAVTFETVDELQRGWVPNQGFLLRVRGIPQGQSEAIQLQALVSTSDETTSNNCERMALMAVSRPGRYFFEMVVSDPSTRPSLFRCRLIRRP